MDDVLTFDEMKARYAPDWVLLGDPVLDEGQRILAGKVLFHSPDRDTVYDKVLEYPPGRYGFRCFAEYPEDMVLIL